MISGLDIPEITPDLLQQITCSYTLLNDPFRRIGQWIYEAVAKSLKSISDSAWKDEDKTI